MNQSLDEVFSKVNALYPDSFSDSSKELNLVYGEVLIEEAPKIAKALDMNESDVVIDLGSGLGKLAIAWHLMTPSKIIGIERHKGRYDQAINAWEKLKATEAQDKLEFSCQDFLSYDLSSVTIIYCGSTCFSEALITDLTKHINNYTNIRLVATLKPLPNLNGFKRVGRIRVECSWDSAFLYLFKKTAA